MLREAAKKRLEHTNMLLNATLANMPHGICMFGPDTRLVLANELYSTMYGLARDAIRPGMTLAEVLQLRVAAGSCPADPQKYVRDRLHEAFLPTPVTSSTSFRTAGRWPSPGAACPTAARLPSTRTSRLT